MSRVDELLERGADHLQDLADDASTEDGLKAKLAEPLAEDADLLRKLKPSLIAARARGEEPRRPPTSPELPKQAPKPKSKPKHDASGGSGGPNPFLIAGAALALGIFLAKWIDWRGHAHPRV